MTLSDQLRALITEHHTPEDARTARTNHTNAAPDVPDSHSALCARDSLVIGKPDSTAVRVLADQWNQDTLEHYLERLAIADEQEMDTSPGGPAEVTARREADRVAAGVPFTRPASRGGDAIDQALKAFAPQGGLSFVRFEGKGETP